MAKLTFDLTGQSISLPKTLVDHEPTHVSRYWIIAQLLHSLTHQGRLKILDVGGKEGLLREFETFSPVVLDTQHSNEPNFILGSGLDMPFNDDEFDVTVSCDVLEHIAANDRHKFITEMLRVGKELSIICAPFNNPGVSDAEIIINDYYKSLLGRGHQWLQEHIDNGLPSEKSTEKTIKEAGLNFIKFRHFSLDLWPKILKLHLQQAALGDNQAITETAEAVYKNYYSNLCMFDFSNLGYRTFYVVSKSLLELKLPSSQKILDRKNRFFDDFLGLLVLGLEQQALSYRKSIQKAGSLQQRLKMTTNELEAIKSSKSWQAARKIAKVKKLIKT